MQGRRELGWGRGEVGRRSRGGGGNERRRARGGGSNVRRALADGVGGWAGVAPHTGYTYWGEAISRAPLPPTAEGGKGGDHAGMGLDDPRGDSARGLPPSG